MTRTERFDPATADSAGPRLTLVAPAPVQRQGDGLRLDRKFVEGVRSYVRLWPGPVRCVLRETRAEIPFGDPHEAAALPFELRLLAPGEAVTPEAIAGSAIVYGSADSPDLFGVGHACRATGVPLVVTVEYTLETRLRIARLERRGLARGAYGMMWNLAAERRRRALMRQADAVDMNGYPAFRAYRRLNPDNEMFLDGRMRAEMMATPDEMARRRAHLAGGGPLRLIHSGRLEPMKGAQDLVPVAAALRRAGCAFTLDIFGAGSLTDQIAAGIAEQGLGAQVRLHGPVDFETRLVPFARQQADAFLSCHRQSDPSCTYLESMGCGLPVFGYANGMLSGLARDSAAAVTVRMGDTGALARTIAGTPRDDIATMSDRARAFAARHDQQTVFAARVGHLRAVLDRAGS